MWDHIVEESPADPLSVLLSCSIPHLDATRRPRTRWFPRSQPHAPTPCSPGAATAPPDICWASLCPSSKPLCRASALGPGSQTGLKAAKKARQVRTACFMIPSGIHSALLLLKLQSKHFRKYTEMAFSLHVQQYKTKHSTHRKHVPEALQSHR